MGLKDGVRLVRGMRDRLGPTQHGLTHVVKTAARAATLAQYREIGTPIVESTALFTHAIGEATDVVNKEMFSFPDGTTGGSVSLRPEGTAGVMRAALSAKEWRGAPLTHKLFYHGPMFRRERPQLGRYRQFEQFGVENLGCRHPHTDVEVIALGHQLLTDLGLDDHVQLQINSLCDTETRTRHRDELTAFLWDNHGQLSATSRSRLDAGHVLRILDSKDPGDKEVAALAPRLLNVATESARARFDIVLAGLDALAIPYTVNHSLVRGLDYYTSTVWEFETTKLGAQGAVLAGGRYDSLAEQLGASVEVPAIGWAAGVDRLALLQLECGTAPTMPHPFVSIVQVRGSTVSGVDDAKARMVCLALAHALRTAGVSVDHVHAGNTRKQMSLASGQGSSYTILVGDSEIEADTVVLKDMATREQTVIPFRNDATELLSQIQSSKSQQL